MLATAGELPSAADEEAWAFEMKWDGVRAVVYVDGDVRVLTRNDREVAATYPELRGLAGALAGRPLVLDGEIVALDEAGRPSFGQLQARMHVQHPSTALLAQVPVSLLLFDVLTRGASHSFEDVRPEALGPRGPGAGRAAAGRRRRPSRATARQRWRCRRRRGWRGCWPSGGCPPTCRGGGPGTG